MIPPRPGPRLGSQDRAPSLSPQPGCPGRGVSPALRDSLILVLKHFKGIFVMCTRSLAVFSLEFGKRRVSTLAKADSSDTCERVCLLQAGFSAQILRAKALRSVGKAAWLPGQPDPHHWDIALGCTRQHENHPHRRRLKKNRLATLRATVRDQLSI